MSFKRSSIVTAAYVSLVSAVSTMVAPAHAESGPDFYKGKEIRLMIAGAAGGGYDTYGRFLARNLPRFIPGEPRITPENMPGAAGIRMANFLYTAAPKDGTVIGISAGSIMTTSLLGVGAVKFDARRLTWIGSMNEEVGMIISWHTSPVKTADDLFSRELIVGGTSVSDDNVLFPYLLNNLVGTKMKPVAGYTGTPEISLAMERGEVHGIGSWHYSSIMTSKPDWIKDGKLNFLVQLSLRRHPDVPNVPTVLDLAKDEEQREVMEMLFSQQTMGRPIYAPADIPADRVRILQKAFADMMTDPDVLRQATEQNIEINNPMTGEDMVALIEHLHAMPPQVVARARASVMQVPKEK